MDADSGQTCPYCRIVEWSFRTQFGFPDFHFRVEVVGVVINLVPKEVASSKVIP